jgi:hypothetical protein
MDLNYMHEMLAYASFPSNDTRCMILPPGDVGWHEVFAREFPGITVRENKSFSGEMCDVGKALLTRSKHRFFSLSLPIGTLLVDGGASLNWPKLDALCQEYSRLNQCAVIWVQTQDYDCPYPEITAWHSGSLIRKHAPGLREKAEHYLRHGWDTQEGFDWMMERHRSVGVPLACEQNPDARSILAFHGWTEEVFTQSGWKSVTTDFD